MKIVMLGHPGAGKGTQSKLIESHLERVLKLQERDVFVAEVVRIPNTFASSLIAVGNRVRWRTPLPSSSSIDSPERGFVAKHSKHPPCSAVATLKFGSDRTLEQLTKIREQFWLVGNTHCSA